MSLDIADISTDDAQKEGATGDARLAKEAPVMLIVGADAEQKERLRSAGEASGFIVEGIGSLGALPPRLELDPDLLVLTSELSDCCTGEELPTSYRARTVLLVSDDGWATLASAGIGGGIAASASVAELNYRLPDALSQIQREARAKLGLPMSNIQSGLWDLIPATDWVTGLDNRLRFMQELEKNSSRARRYKRPFCCLLVRFNNYETLRQTEQGDECVNGILEEVAGLLEVSIRDADFLARMHHDLFGLLLPETDLENAQVVVTRIHQNLQQFAFNAAAVPVAPSFSCGMSAFEAESSTVDSLLAEAHRALEENHDS